ncbi:protein disulfide-isomerase-like protein of the testis-like [Platysternon megacephalum]|uniref:Protein disulfide-isomerase-like protein of the testis-like n=1 Tax=Platysternon megacephalum TaxID=55544 RepID=A0A4D9E8B4_9SAUR|nr:protein disulfide-isomerase-like protein of the testis-like [Platysternon megacephalum]
MRRTPIEIPCAAYVTQSGTPSFEWKFEKGSSIVLLYYDSKFTDPYKDRAQFTLMGIRFTSVTRKDTGKYICEVLWTGTGGSGQLRKSEVDLIVQDGSPPPTCQWYRDNVLMPSNPKINEKFRNSCYAIDPKTGVLTNEPVTSFDTGDYFCEAQNNVGTAQKSEAIHLEASKEMGTCRACVWVRAHVRTRLFGSHLQAYNSQCCHCPFPGLLQLLPVLAAID